MTDYTDIQKRNPEEITALKNPTTKRKTVSWDGKPYELEAGETKAFINYVAANFVKHNPEVVEAEVTFNQPEKPMATTPTEKKEPERPKAKRAKKLKKV